MRKALSDLDKIIAGGQTKSISEAKHGKIDCNIDVKELTRAYVCVDVWVQQLKRIPVKTREDALCISLHVMMQNAGMH